jgi:hypothetical protein
MRNGPVMCGSFRLQPPVTAAASPAVGGTGSRTGAPTLSLCTMFTNSFSGLLSLLLLVLLLVSVLLLLLLAFRLRVKVVLITNPGCGL